MAAYDLRVQKPSSLAVPKGPGSDDLARFLSVSEANRANTQKEQIQRDTLDWERGAQDRALAAAEAERERVRQENMARGRTSTETVGGYLSDAQENYRLSDEALQQFDEMFPNATPEQRDGVRQAARDRITQTPGAYIDQKQMGYDLENTLVNDHGWGRKQAQQEAARQMSAHFAAPGKMDDEVKKGYVDAIGDSGIADNLLSYYKGNSGSKGSGDSDFMKSVKFLQDRQLDYEGNNLRQGSRPFYSWNLPFTDHELYTDDMNRLSSAIQLETGINPMYVNSVILSRAENGRIPNGVSPEDLMDKNGDYYKAIKADAKRLQGIAEGGQRGGGRGNLNPEALRQVKQNEMDARFKALEELDSALQSRGGRPLTSEEQFQIMSDPELLKEFDLIMKQSTPPKQAGANTPLGGVVPAPVPAPVPVPEAGANVPAPDTEIPVGENENTDLAAMIEGKDKPGSDNTEQNGNSISLADTLQREKDALEERISEVYREGGTLESLPQLTAELNSVSDKQDDVYAENVKNIVDSGITDAELKDKIPNEYYRSRAKSLITKIKDGSANKSQMLELHTILKDFR